MTATAALGTRDLAWIKQSLQSALELEYATLPLYLSSMFSLEVQNYTAYNTIRSVAMEEMVHMAIACNMLAALGGSPRIKNIAIRFPVRGLPGGAEPDLHVSLAPYSKNQLRNFLRIETPQLLLRDLRRHESYPTIAAFYESIRDAIVASADAVRAAVKAGGPANQVGDDIGFTTIQYNPKVDPVPTLCAAIDEILEQGEGASAGNLITTTSYETEESHYAKFGSLFYGAHYQEPNPRIELSRETEYLFFQGGKIGWPTVVNTLAVPADGYARLLALDPASSAVTADLTAFDTAFSSLLSALDAAWNGPAAVSWKTLGGAVHSMVDLRVLSCFNILRHEIPADLVARLPTLYPDEIDTLRRYTDLSAPVFYGPRFVNTNLTK
ncbi:MAG TPA: ferritin-like protein [Kofleriaceae bacterium]|nr:ferritin-like protein [Kofleriaceae bacterium]